MSQKPGVMIYTDIQRILDRLSDEHAGILFRAIVQYGTTKTVPELPEALYLMWPLIQLRLDTDDQRYRMVSQKRKYAIYVRWAKHHEQTPMSFETWLAELNEDEMELD